METSVPVEKFGIREFSEELKKPRTEQPQEIEERKLAALAEYPGWEILKGRIETSIQNLRELAEVDAPGITMEEVGYKFMASRVAMAKLQEIINIVEMNAAYQRNKEAEDKILNQINETTTPTPTEEAAIE